jgi:anthranilate phosphoribosyltransferase
VLVCSRDGLDEVSLSAPTMVRVVVGDEFRVEEWTPEMFGLGEVPLAELLADGPAASAAIIRRVLAGEDIPAKRVVLVNAAAALWTAGAVPTLRDGVDRAAESVRGGKARHVLEQLTAAV